MSNFLSDATFGLIDTSTPDYAGAAKMNEARRQALIKAGLAQINAIYGGGTVPVYTAVTERVKRGGMDSLPELFTVNPKDSTFARYIPKGKPGESFSSAGAIQGSQLGALLGPIPAVIGGLMGGFLGTDSGKSPRDILNRKIRNQNIYTADTESYEGFTPEFYAVREKAYTDAAMPQVMDQFKQVHDASLYSMANRGLLGSSAAGESASRLNRELGSAQRTVADSALAQAQELQRQVAAQKQASIAQLYQTADPSQSAAAAIAGAASMRTPSPIPSLGNMFSNFINQAATQQLLSAYRPASYVPYSGSFNSAGALPPVIR